MRKPRKSYTPPEKVAILRRHLIDKVPVSDLCDEYQLQPTLFYAWQKLLFENAHLAFENGLTARPGGRIFDAAKSICVTAEMRTLYLRPARRAALGSSGTTPSTGTPNACSTSSAA